VRRASQRSTIDSRSPHRPGRFGLGSLVGPVSPAPKTRFIQYAKLGHSLHRRSVTSWPRPRRSLIERRLVNSTIPFGNVSLRLMQRSYVMAAKRPRPSIPISDASRASSSSEKPPLALQDSVAMRIGCRRGQVIPQAGWPTERRIASSSARPRSAPCCPAEGVQCRFGVTTRDVPAMPYTMQIAGRSEAQKTYSLVNQTESAWVLGVNRTYTLCS
jgi:hypothetical protein